MYDLIIIGLGPAGLSASIYAKRAGLNVLVLEKETPGGMLNKIRTIENFIGYESITGPELAMNFYKQFKALKIPMFNEEVVALKDEGNKKLVHTTENQYEAKAVIIATGRGQKKLSIGHDIKGVSYCALCDANLYQGQAVALVGNNPKAIEEAIYLSSLASKVYLIIDGAKINASSVNIKLLNKANIEVIFNEEVTAIASENERIKTVNLKTQNLEVAGLFVNLGSGPTTHFCESLGITDKTGYILVGADCETNVLGVYAAGDSIKKSTYQIIHAASEGATAGISANKYIKGIK